MRKERARRNYSRRCVMVCVMLTQTHPSSKEGCFLNFRRLGRRKIRLVYLIFPQEMEGEVEQSSEIRCFWSRQRGVIFNAFEQSSSASTSRVDHVVEDILAASNSCMNHATST